MDDAAYLKPGQLVCFTAGEYSDYRLQGAFVAIATASQNDALELVREIMDRSEDAEEKVGWYDGDVQTEFLEAMIGKGWLVSVDWTEHHIGSYGSLEIL